MLPFQWHFTCIQYIYHCHLNSSYDEQKMVAVTSRILSMFVQSLEFEYQSFSGFLCLFFLWLNESTFRKYWCVNAGDCGDLWCRWCVNAAAIIFVCFVCWFSIQGEGWELHPIRIRKLPLKPSNRLNDGYMHKKKVRVFPW